MSRHRQFWKNLALTAMALAHCAAALASLRVSRFVVAGPSMAPGLLPGDRLLVIRNLHRLIAPTRGEVVLARPAALGDRDVVKRVAGTRAGTYVLLGDNPALSTDSRHFGPLPRDQIAARVWLRYWPDERKGLIRRARPLSARQADRFPVAREQPIADEPIDQPIKPGPIVRREVQS